MATFDPSDHLILKSISVILVFIVLLIVFASYQHLAIDISQAWSLCK